MPSFPDAARLEVPAALARDLRRAAERLPLYENKDFYSLRLQAELRDAVRSACRDGFDWLRAEVEERLRREPCCVLVDGLSFDPGNRLFVAVNRAFGELVARPYEAPRAQLVHYIQPATDIKTSDGRQTESERLHTDSADWPEPVEVISMVCLRPDRKGGGRSRILTLETLRQEVGEKLGAATLGLLERPVPWRMDDANGGGMVWRPIVTATSIRWRRYTIDAALSAAGITLPPAQSRALDDLDELIAATDRALDCLMSEGELLFMDNHRTLHSRTPLSGGYRTSGRLMLRSWIRRGQSENRPAAR